MSKQRGVTCLVGEGFRDKLVENKSAEVSHFLDMLRSASSDDSGRSYTSHTDWKVRFLLSAFSRSFVFLIYFFFLFMPCSIHLDSEPFFVLHV